jgi:hypothetical protein
MFTWSIFFLLLKMTNSVFCGLNFTNHVSAHVFNIFISEFNFLSAIILTTRVKGRPNEFTFTRKLKYLLSRSHLSKIYKTYILPILEYGCELWDVCNLKQQGLWRVYLFILVLKVYILKLVDQNWKTVGNGIYLISILVCVKCVFVWSPFGMCC